MVGKGWSVAAPAAIFVLSLIPLAMTPVLPLIDFYNHVARFFVLAHIDASPFLQHYYEARWSLLPNIGVDVLGTPLLAILPPLIAAKAIIVIIMAVLFSGALYFHRAVTGTRSLLVAVLLAPLLYSYILNWGFANFLLGLGLVFWAGGWWLRMRHRPAIAVPVSCLLALAIFFCHGIAFLLYGVMIVSLEIGAFLAAPKRDPRQLGRMLALAMLTAVLPVVYFLLWKTGHAPGGGSAVAALNLEQIPLSERIVRAGLYHIRTIVRVEEGPAGWFDAATFVMQIVAVGILLHERKLAIPPHARFMAIAVVILAALPLPTLFGVGYIGDRTPLFAAMALIGALSVRPGGWTGISRLMGGILIAIAVVRIAATSVHWHSQTRMYDEFRSVTAHIRPQSLTIGIAVGSTKHATHVPRCEMYGPLLIAELGHAGPLFADEKQQPLRLIGPMKGGGSTGRRQAIEYRDQVIRPLDTGYDNVLVCNSHLLPEPVPQGTRPVATSEHFVLLRRQ